MMCMMLQSTTAKLLSILINQLYLSAHLIRFSPTTLSANEMPTKFWKHIWSSYGVVVHIHSWPSMSVKQVSPSAVP